MQPGCCPAEACLCVLPAYTIKHASHQMQPGCCPAEACPCVLPACSIKHASCKLQPDCQANAEACRLAAMWQQAYALSARVDLSQPLRTIGQRFSWLERPQASAGVKHQAASADAQGSVGLIAAEPEQSQLVTGQDYT